MRTIGLEEHFVTPELVGYGAGSASIIEPSKWREASRRLLDITGERLTEMDSAGLDVQVLSLNSPGIQAETDAVVAVARATAVNDLLADVVRDHPDRFAGFAALPLQDPQAAAKELDRSVTELGMRGALVNAHTQGRYLDDPQLRVVWERAEALDVPLYLHPANGVGTPHVIEGHPELIGPMWSWGTETASHFLRCVFGGVFDDFPRAKLLLGHMGEGLPYVMWRLDSRWEYHNHHGVELARGNPSEYLRHNLYVTTSGVCSAPPLLCALLALGPERILFGTDYPFEDMATATAFLDSAPISESDRARISHLNAEQLLHL
ncbi:MULTISPECIES: amidohydrolase family protein [unclassified Streptomyces]|uniref:amidohydrolase family protein n=1 Tax=unclassified Streptomyces TaxID=2593676 RepID=UPI002DDA0871|nr:amidohydrolase family protein [Streptomyces sp. NBC_01257]WRZ69676.1 amidohydrolase family protein [Streptomyces sp. NBC_01257]